MCIGHRHFDYLHCLNIMNMYFRMMKIANNSKMLYTYVYVSMEPTRNHLTLQLQRLDGITQSTMKLMSSNYCSL